MYATKLQLSLRPGISIGLFALCDSGWDDVGDFFWQSWLKCPAVLPKLTPVQRAHCEKRERGEWRVVAVKVS